MRILRFWNQLQAARDGICTEPFSLDLDWRRKRPSFDRGTDHGLDFFDLVFLTNSDTF